MCDRKMLVKYLKIVSVLTVMFMMFLAIGCSSDMSQSPEAFIKSFLKEHVSPVNMAVVDFYVMDEQATVSDRISKNIQAKQEEGIYKDLVNATYDFSNLKVSVVGKKETYVDDEPKTVVELKASGSYSMKINGQNRDVPADEVFVIEAVGDQWKVTDRVEPWI